MRVDLSMPVPLFRLVSFILLFQLIGCIDLSSGSRSVSQASFQTSGLGGPGGNGEGFSGKGPNGVGIVAYGSARLLCGYEQFDLNGFEVKCNIGVELPTGEKVPGTELAPETTLDWRGPIALSGSPISALICTRGEFDLSQNCRFKLDRVFDGSTLKIDLIIHDESRNETRTESKDLVLNTWITPAELALLSVEDPGWSTPNGLLDQAALGLPHPDLGVMNEHTPNILLALTIVAEKTGADDLRDKVTQTLDELVSKGNPGGEGVHAWARGLTGYVMAADLIGYRTPEFYEYLRQITSVWVDPKLNTTMEGLARTNIQNHGMYAVAALATVYAYLHDQVKLEDLVNFWKQAVQGPAPRGIRRAFHKSRTWQWNESKPVLINPAGAYKECFGKIDGIMPGLLEEGCTKNPKTTGDLWSGFGAQFIFARVAERAGIPVWQHGDRAILRAAIAIEEGLKFSASKHAMGAWIYAFLVKAYPDEKKPLEWFCKADVSKRYRSGRAVGFAWILGEIQCSD